MKADYDKGRSFHPLSITIRPTLSPRVRGRDVRAWQGTEGFPTDDVWTQELPLPHPSLPPTIPFLHSIFQNRNLRSPAVQGAPECIYGELHFITHSCTAASFTLGVLLPPCLWPMLHCAGKILHRCCMLPDAALLEMVGVPSVLAAYQDGEISTPSPLLAYREPYIFRWRGALCEPPRNAFSSASSPSSSGVAPPVTNVRIKRSRCHFSLPLWEMIGEAELCQDGYRSLSAMTACHYPALPIASAVL
ncbi:hypothetical protein EYF80_007275 [Liparis tanakae]|uniref:Uncharacterized protein n=1 Tax=Liparis tanakae TaxID=230148 RepID=A0A4Z2IWU4_9TELE|nr:hypothetical protein EYF80_007275 [Liparis tanakae]